MSIRGGGRKDTDDPATCDDVRSGMLFGVSYRLIGVFEQRILPDAGTSDLRKRSLEELNFEFKRLI
jgi:hypothetical protein